jgi:hypothetical protein
VPVIGDQRVRRAGIAVADDLLVHGRDLRGQFQRPADPERLVDLVPVSRVERALGCLAPRVPSRRRADQVNGQPSTGSASCMARSPSPIARTAVAGSASHRSAMAIVPARALVTSHSAVSSDA